MRIRTLIVVFLFLLVVLFAALNWAAFTAPTELWLGVATVRAPLGLILLAMIVFLAAVFLGYVVYLQTSFLMEARRNARELQAQRGLADQAEASRFTELRGHLDARLTEIENSLSAQLGEMRGSMHDRSDH
ncbi:MAG TPA: LapA family protein [Burkholderiales bacterium]|nr:LapA family protein [Burkholderiales bacterium]